MEAGKILINGIFNGHILEIPFYQRAYVWKDEQWERFVEDMETVTQEKMPYFLGSIIFKTSKHPHTWENVPEVKTVIDGQQRLTTLVIFMKVLCLKNGQDNYFCHDFILEDGETIALQLGLYDSEAFKDIVFKTNLNPVPINEHSSQIYKAFNYFIENIDPEKVNRNIIKQNIQFVCIDLTENEDEQQIFDTINSLGVKLTTAELLKNYFFDRNNIHIYKEKWVSVFEKDEETKA
ncbi:MAG: DUF262 domain-containing protein [Clostridia bacterium]|nr:DUF262 domain-containing protein [Clostridia bacterium]